MEDADNDINCEVIAVSIQLPKIEDMFKDDDEKKLCIKVMNITKMEKTGDKTKITRISHQVILSK
eukprot:4914562-Ditylum_brightwellii.AAC.1